MGLSLSVNVSAGPPPPTSGNLVVNGGFETGDLTGWSYSGFTFISGGGYSNASFPGPHSGNYYLSDGSSGGLGYISQNLATVTGTRYILNYYMASDGYTPNEFKTVVGATTLFDQTNIPLHGYTQSGYIFTATSASTLLQFGLRDDPGALSLDDVAVVALNIEGTPGLTPNQFNIAQNLDSYNGGGTLGNVVVDVALASDPSTIAEDLNELSPQKLQVMREIAFNNFGFTAGQIDDHTASLRYGQGGFDASGFSVLNSSMPSMMAQIKGHLLAWNPAPEQSGLMSDVADPMVSGVTMADPKDLKEMAPESPAERFSSFISGNVVVADQDSTPDAANAHFTTGGVTAGADYRLNDNWAIGGLFGYGHTSATTDSNGSRTRVDSYSPGIYATYADHGWFANGLFTYNYNSYNESRAIPFLGSTASGSPTGNQYNGNLDGGYEFESGNVTFGPTMGLQYTHLDIDSFTEGGAGAADLAVNSQSADSLRSRLGGEFRYNWLWYGKVTATPHLGASWQHEYLDNSNGIFSQFNGQGLGSFVVNTTSPERDSALIDAGLDTQWNNALSLFVDYQAQAGQDNFFAQSIEVGCKVSF
jgi:outer membrane autotransporter protein